MRELKMKLFALTLPLVTAACGSTPPVQVPCVKPPAPPPDANPKTPRRVLSHAVRGASSYFFAFASGSLALRRSQARPGVERPSSAAVSSG